MSEAEKASLTTPVEAVARTSEHNDDYPETPMLAVWLSLGAILIAGLYGLYLGTAAKSKKTDERSTTMLEVPRQGDIAHPVASSSVTGGRLT